MASKEEEEGRDMTRNIGNTLGLAFCYGLIENDAYVLSRRWLVRRFFLGQTVSYSLIQHHPNLFTFTDQFLLGLYWGPD